MRADLTNRLASVYYGHRKDFQMIAQRVGSPDNHRKLLQKIEIEVKNDLQVCAIKQQLLILTCIYVAAVCALAIPVVCWLFNVLTTYQRIGIAIAGVLLLLPIGHLIEWRRKAYKKRHQVYLDKYARALRVAEQQDIDLTKRIEEAWDSYCVNYDGYPPDWKYRVLFVLERDHHTCTQCGWPNGFKRKARELHVHHVERHSQGGSHAFPNLVTLCDTCHSKQAGPGHNFIKRHRKKRRGIHKSKSLFL